MKAEYPGPVITQDRKGQKEVRMLVERGRYVRYHYIDPETGKTLEKGKESLILENENKKREHIFLIPMSPGKSLAITPKEERSSRKVWNDKTKSAEDLF